MSGPLRRREAEVENDPLDHVEVREGRSTTVGGLDIIRVLPTKGRRTVGSWCFVDCMFPPDVDDPTPLEVGPHPHIGLSTVTWLFEGEALHGDSLGTEQVIKPGQLNLMTAGRGIAHSELGTGGRVKGVQMWLAQPDETRDGTSRFEHHADLPTYDFTHADATVFLGSLDGAVSPALTDTDVVGADVRFRGGAIEFPSVDGFEYAVVPLDRRVKVGEVIVEPGWLGLVPPGLDVIPIDAEVGARAMVLGGLPLGESVQMWWNFVARTKDEITEAWKAWQSDDTDRFGRVPSSLDRIDAPPPPWLTSTER